MAAMVRYYRNYNDADDTCEFSSATFADPATFGWTRELFTFKAWNTARDGSGTSYNIGDQAVNAVVYAIWEGISFLVSASDLASVADSIRTKGGTSGQLEFPTGFNTAIANIPSGGGGTTTITANTNLTANVEYVDPSGVPTERNGFVLGDSLDVLSKSLIVTSGPMPLEPEPGLIYFQNATFIRTQQESARTPVYINYFQAD